jgi:hypothetical protein
MLTPASSHRGGLEARSLRRPAHQSQPRKSLREGSFHTEGLPQQLSVLHLNTAKVDDPLDFDKAAPLVGRSLCSTPAGVSGRDPAHIDEEEVFQHTDRATPVTGSLGALEGPGLTLKHASPVSLLHLAASSRHTRILPRLNVKIFSERDLAHSDK